MGNAEKIEKEFKNSVMESSVQEGKLVSLKKDSIKTVSGAAKQVETVLHPGAVVIIPRTGENQIIFVKQYRHSVSQILIEFPAGTLHPGEDPFSCADRELQEEIGFRSKDLTLLGGFFTTPGFCNEYIHVFLAKELIPSVLFAEDTEEIDILELSLEEAFSMVLNHQIIDAKTICCLSFLEKWNKVIK